MNRRRSSLLPALPISLALGTSLAISISACSNAPREFNTDASSSSSAGSGGSGGAVGSGGGGAGGSGAGGCDPGAAPSEDACVIEDDLGIFVSQKGNDLNPGTKVAPVQTLAKAIQLAVDSKKRVYACAEAFNEAIVVPAGVEIYGGLDCAAAWGWVGASAKTTIATAPDVIPVVLSAGDLATKLEDLWIQAASASAAGGSSIALLADSITASIARCKLVAGDGVIGGDGKSASQIAAPGGLTGLTGATECVATNPPGGAPTANSKCPTSIGGGGGDGSTSGGKPGASGQPALGGGFGGLAGCTSGQVGASGMPGAPGMGGSGTGSFLAMGFAGPTGGTGTSGGPGQGGGGGGGVTSTALCQVGKGGAGGGSGGAGGCGGSYGTGGQAGGSSIALASVKATISIVESELISGKGGAGGKGGSAQPGGLGGKGGLGGTGTPKGCNGGTGGDGGNGGPGGGGRGGHSLGIAYVGAAPEESGVTFTPGSGGIGGEGGNANLAGNAGEVGLVAESQAIDG